MVEDYYFDKSFYKEFLWGDKRYSLGVILPENKDDLQQAMRELSQNSIRNRFLGGKKLLTESELKFLTQFDGINHFALGIRNEQNRGVAVVRMVRSSQNKNQAEVAITIIDEYQNQGLGTLLLTLIACAAFERGIDGLILDLLPQNEGMQKLVRKVGQITRKVSTADTITYTLALNEREMNESLQKIKKVFV